VAVLLAVIIILRLRRTTHARSRNDEKLTVVIVLVFGVLIDSTLPPWPFSPGPQPRHGLLPRPLTTSQRS
jgi:hypothetical protein